MRTWVSFVATLAAAMSAQAQDEFNPYFSKDCFAYCRPLTHKRDGKMCINKTTKETCMLSKCAAGSNQKACKEGDEELSPWDLLDIRPSGGVDKDAQKPIGRMGVPGTQITLSRLTNGQDAWSHNGANAPVAKFVTIPSIIQGMPVAMSSYVAKEGMEYVFNCPAREKTVCDFYMFFYHCEQSCSTEWQKGITDQLSEDREWRRTLCAPYFQNGATHYHQRMRGFHRQAPPGTRVVIRAESNVEFIAMSASYGGVDCKEQDTQQQCESAGPVCRWKNDKCSPENCVIKQVGPPPPCKECAWTGLDDSSMRKEAGPY